MTPIRIGHDITKNVFQAHGVDDKGIVVIRKRLRRPDIQRFFASLPPCLIGVEACSASHHWARELIRPSTAPSPQPAHPRETAASRRRKANSRESTRARSIWLSALLGGLCFAIGCGPGEAPLVQRGISDG